MNRACINAMRSEYNITPLSVEIVSYSDDGKRIIFGADGHYYDFMSKRKPSSLTKRQWQEKKLWSIKQIDVQ